MFGLPEIVEFLDRAGGTSPRYVNPSSAATYLVQFARAGFVIDRVERMHDGVDEELIGEHHAKLRWLDPDELRTTGLSARLRRPLVPNLASVDGDAAHS